jgi:hypothetical protein
MQARHLMILATLACFIAIGPVGATNLNQAKGTVDNIRAADPPRLSTST